MIFDGLDFISILMKLKGKILQHPSTSNYTFPQAKTRYYEWLAHAMACAASCKKPHRLDDDYRELASTRDIL